MSSREMKKRNSFFTRKKEYGHKPQDSFDFSREMSIRESKSKPTFAQKVDNAAYNLGAYTNHKLNKNVKNLSKMEARNAADLVDKLVPQKLVRWTVRFIMFVYGFIGILSLLLLVFYCMDYFISFWYSDYSSYDYVFLYSIIGLCSVGAFLGLYGTFKFGEIDEQMQILKSSNENLKTQVHNVADTGEKLKDSIEEFQNQVDSIMDNENDLKAQIKAFQKLEQTLKSESKSNNAEIVGFLRDVQTLFRDFKVLQVQVEKTNLLNLFYEIEFRDDDIEGLNENEYEMFLARLDDETASKFKMKSFKEMDVNGDGTIDLKYGYIHHCCKYYCDYIIICLVNFNQNWIGYIIE